MLDLTLLETRKQINSNNAKIVPFVLKSQSSTHDHFQD